MNFPKSNLGNVEGGKVDAQLDRRVMEQVTGRFARRNVGPLGEIMGRRHEAIAESSGSYEMPACKRDWPHKLGRLRIYERHKRMQDIMNGETAVGSCRGVAGREGNKGGRLLREIFIARDISQLHLLTVYEGNSGERGGNSTSRNFLLNASLFQFEFEYLRLKSCWKK